jgi:hypothetical protein
MRAVFGFCALVLLSAISAARGGPTPPPPAVSTFSALETAIDAAAARSLNPELARRSLLLRLGGAPTCYPDDLSPEEYEAIFQATGLLPPGEGGGDGIQVRYYIEFDAWYGDGLIDSSSRAQAAQLTYSFPDDGVTWGLSASGFATGPNVLNANLVSTFGDLDLGREYIRQAIAAWRLHAGLTYTEVADNNSVMDQSVGRTSLKGDIRIGSTNFGSGVLAYNAYPLGSGSSSLSGGDMCLNAHYFAAAYFNNVGNDYRYLRNTVTHEHGHGVGLRHAVPCNVSKIMEPTVGNTLNGIQIDDIRGGQRNYGDRFSGNYNGANATQLGELALPASRSVYLASVSTNGHNGYNNSFEDWYTFTLSTPRNVVITVEPYGGVYSISPQSSGCTVGTLTEVNAGATGNLRIELRKPANTLLQTADTGGVGQSETLNAGSLTAGTYFVKVRDVNINGDPDDQRVQLYNFKIAVEGAPFPPLACAGIGKRIAASTECWFIGHLLSRAQHPDATLTGYEWDFNGDGMFETEGSPASFQYVSNGTHQAVLRVTDSNGATATDTINVNVWNAQTSVTSVSPIGASPNSTVPVTIDGTNFKGVTNASQVTVSGTGVSVVGTPVVNHMGTRITGLSFIVASNAALSARNVTVTNSDGLGGTATGTGLFTVGNLSGACCFGTTCTVTTQAGCSGGTWQGPGTTCGSGGSNPTTCCRANFDGVGGVQVPDIFAFLSAWFAGNASANIDGVNGVAVPDIFAFLSLWFAGC